MPILDYWPIISTIMGIIVGVITLYFTPLIKEGFELRGQYFAPFKRWCSKSYADLKEFKVRYVESNFNLTFSNVSDIQIILDYWSLHEICIDAYKWIGKIKKDNPAVGEELIDMIEVIERFWHSLENDYSWEISSVNTAKEFNANIKFLSGCKRKEIADKIRDHLVEKKAEYLDVRLKSILDYLHKNAPSNIRMSLRDKAKGFSKHFIKPRIELGKLEAEKREIELTSLDNNRAKVYGKIWSIPVYNKEKLSRDALECQAEIVINEDMNETFRLLWKGHSQLPQKCVDTRDDYKANLLFFLIKNLLDKRKYTYLSKGKSNDLLFLFTFTESKCVYIIGTRISKYIIDESITEGITAEEYICKEDDIFSIPIDKLNTYNFDIKLYGREYRNVLKMVTFKLVKKSQDKDGLPTICFEIIKSMS